MNQDLQDLVLKEKVEKVFIQNQADINQPSVLAAMITAASQMAIQSNGLATPDMTTDELLNLYEKSDDQQVTDLIGMSSAFVKTNIGYSVEFEDASLATMAYNSIKSTYDEVYRSIAIREATRNMNTGRSL